MTQRIVPMIAYADAGRAIDWLTEAFGFREREGQRFTDEHGTVTHAELERDGAIVMLATPNAEYQGPRRHRETCEAARRWQDNPWVIDGVFVEVDDVRSDFFEHPPQMPPVKKMKIAVEADRLDAQVVAAWWRRFEVQ